MTATWIGSAKARLLPPAIPFAFFLLALCSHFFGWLLLLKGADSVVTFAGGLGLPLAALHLITLGTLSAAAMGAGYQMLPVAAKAELPALWPCWLSLVLLAMGVPTLAWGMTTASVWALTMGGFASVLALVTFAVVLALSLTRARGLPVVTAHVAFAIGSLIAGALIGLAVAGNFVHGYLADHGTAAMVHLALMSYGFLGVLAAGFSQILVPMFALAPNPPARAAYAVLGAAALALVALLAGLPGAAAVIGLGAASAHVATMFSILRRRARRKLGAPFVLIRLSWVLLPLGLLLGLAAATGLHSMASKIFVVVLVFGWLLSFVIGVLMRILPFLAAMNAGRAGGRVPKVADLTNAGLLWVQAVLHPAALAMLALAVVSGEAALVRAAAVVGAAGAAAFLLFAADVALRAGGLRSAITIGREKLG